MPKFITNQNIELELELASVGDRIVAWLLDTLIVGAYVFLMAMIAGGFGAGGITLFILILPVFFYNLLFEIFGQGQTPGKRARDIKVVKIDGSSPTLGSYLIRWMFRIVDVYLFYGCIGIVSMVSSRNSQRIGDMVAGTTVTKVRTKDSIQAFKPIPEEHRVQFPTARMLTDEQVDLMKKAMRTYRQNGNPEVINQLSLKLQDKLGVISSLPDQEFLETVIKDYEYLMNEA